MTSVKKNTLIVIYMYLLFHIILLGYIYITTHMYNTHCFYASL